MNKVLQIILCLAFLVGCKNQKVVTDKTSSDFVIIEESSCEGYCPVYKMIIYQDGKATFFGKENTIKTGEHSYVYKKENLQELFKLFNTLNFDELENIENSIVDIPETKITFNEKVIIVTDVRILPEDYKKLIELLKKTTRLTNYIN